MKTSVKFDTREFEAAIKRGRFTRSDMLDLEKPVALTVVNKQREKVPVDTGATRASIGQHIQKATETEVVDHIGPETDYAPYIELGVISKPNYPIQPFVRPSVFGNENNINRAATEAFKMKISEKYGR